MKIGGRREQRNAQRGGALSITRPFALMPAPTTSNLGRNPALRLKSRLRRRNVQDWKPAQDVSEFGCQNDKRNTPLREDIDLALMNAGIRSNRELSPELLIGIYRTMLRIRRFEERTAALFVEGVVKGTAHSYIGEEAIASAVCANLRKDDYVGSYHRGHGHCIAKGASLHKMMAELMGRATGYCGGLGGSMHIASLELGILGANGIVGAAMPLCTGAALASKVKGTGQVAVAFFGDGAANQGVFHESLNLASVWKLPVIFICENNHYALTTSFRTSTSIERIADRASAYAMPGHRVDGNDVTEVYETVREAIAHAREGGGRA